VWLAVFPAPKEFPVRHSPRPSHSVRPSRFIGALLFVLTATTSLLMQACVVSPDENAALAKTDTLVVLDTLTVRDTVIRIDSARVLDGMWEFLGGTTYYEENGETGIDTFSIDPENPFERQFYLIGGSLLVWMHYDENSSENYTAASAHSFRRLGASSWLIDSEDTLTVIRRGDTLIFKLVSVEEYYDYYTEETSVNIYRDSLNFRLYQGVFPLTAWLSGLSPEDYPFNVFSVVADGSTVSAYLEEEETDWYKFTATAGETYRMGTTGNTDTYMTLYDISTGSILDEDDDDGQEYNAMILWTCPASGDYHIRVRGYNEYEQGQYGLVVGPAATTNLPEDTIFYESPIDSVLLPRVAAPGAKVKRAHPLLDRLRQSTAKVP
jgi:hypothetical protein